MPRRFPILWLTGNTGAGKTTLARGLEQYVNEELEAVHPHARRAIVLDGDDMRATISTQESLSAEDRRSHNLRVARLAAHFQSRGFLVVVAVIAPFASVRKEVDALCQPLWIYVKRSGLNSQDKPYEPPTSPAHVIDTDQLSISDALRSAKAFLLGSLVTTEKKRATV